MRTLPSARILAPALLAALALAAPARAQVTGGVDPRSNDQEKIIELLNEHRLKYGDDATILQGLLMSGAVGARAVLATECGIDGVENVDGKEYLAYHLVTGVIFNDRETDHEDRLNAVWRVIIEGALLRYESFTLAKDGIALDVSWTHKVLRYSARDGSDADDPGPTERVKIYLTTADVAEFVARKLEAKTMLGRSKVLIDGQPGTLDLDELMLPPRPLPSQLYPALD